jgi:hypothetical protein
MGPYLQIAFGIALNLASWRLAWSGPEPLRYHSFFPLWAGYIVAIDGICRAVSGSSLISRLRWRAAWLFLISVPLWWLFEAANSRLDNWSYQSPYEYGWVAYHLEASLAFSTVVPAIFVTGELVRAVALKRPVRWLRLAPSNRQLVTISLVGLAAFLATVLFPETLFPFIWLSLFFAIDPLVARIGGRSLAGQVRVGRWDTVVVLAAATLVCGFCWELWNARSMPKWTYDIHYADWLRIFEMPLLGYGGYIPFGLEVYAIVCFADRVFRLGLGRSFLLDEAPEDC